MTVVLILAGLLFGLVLIFIPKAYLTISSASCDDGKQNQEEEGVDCGGPCITCEYKNPKEIGVVWTKFVRARENSYDVVAFLQNPNEDLASGNLTYRISLFDELGEIAGRQGKTFIFPKEKVLIVEANLATQRLPIRVEFKVSRVEWRPVSIQLPDLAIEKKEYKLVENEGRTQSVVETSIFNRSPFDLKKIEVVIAAFDQEYNLLGASRVLTEGLTAGVRKEVKAVWPEALSGEVAFIEIDPRLNLFESGVILKPR